MTAQPQRSRQLTSDITNSDGIHWRDWHEDIFSDSDQEHKPILLALTATWCHWCHVFNEETLTDERVIAYLNENFVNVFIDADINTSAYQKYKAKGVPFTVFLNPDTSEYYKYSGTLYAEPFLEVIQDVIQNVKQGKTDGCGRQALPSQTRDRSNFSARIAR